MKARTLDRANVNKHVRPTIVRLNKAEAFLAVEPLHNTRSHFRLQCSLIRLLPTKHVSKFDPAMSWGKKPYRAWPSRQPDNSNVVILSVFCGFVRENVQTALQQILSPTSPRSYTESRHNWRAATRVRLHVRVFPPARPDNGEFCETRRRSACWALE